MAPAACSGFLETDNKDTPDVAATLATAAGIQTITATLYQAIWSTSHGTAVAGTNPMYQQLANLAFESHAQTNTVQGQRGALPRTAIPNSRGASGSAEHFRDYSGLSRNSRTAANVIIALDKLIARGQTLGSEALNARARGFAFFTNGVSLGNLPTCASAWPRSWSAPAAKSWATWSRNPETKKLRAGATSGSRP
jgi:hypothetical protein